MAGWRSVWREPRPLDPPPVGRGDALITGAFAAAVLVEAVTRSGMPWHPFVIALALALGPAFLWRRQHPLVSCLVAFGVAGLLSVLQVVSAGAEVGLTSMVAIVLLLFSMVRWGSGREIVLGLTFVAAVVALGMAVSQANWAELIGGVLFVLLCIALGVAARLRADHVDRRHREMRNDERLALARELHDTVAHHVSAIAVQAQAGGVVASQHPQQAVHILAAIESEASRTLAEMRSMVRLLRDNDSDDDLVHRGVADVAALARADGIPAVIVSVAADVTGLPLPVDVALFRIAQESLTNSLRHARHATRVAIEIRRLGDNVRLSVVDDGGTHTGHRASNGFGLTGMTERALLLGGSLTAGPGPRGGWVVEAVLPTGVAR